VQGTAAFARLGTRETANYLPVLFGAALGYVSALPSERLSVCVCVRLHSVHSGRLGVHTQFLAGVGARHRLRVVRCASVLRGQTTPLFRKRAAWDEHLHTIA